MEQACHRCGANIAGQDTFCPACGAPQLNFDASSQEAAEPGVEIAAAQERPGLVHWKDAIGAAIVVGIPAGVLCGLPYMAMLSLVWVMGGASLVIWMYKKKRPLSALSGRSGFRIGSLTGLTIGYVTAAVAAVLSVIQRYPLHVGNTIDHEYESVVSQMMAVVQTTPDTQAQVHSFFQFMLSPDGRATTSLVSLVLIVLRTVFFASLGGYIGVRLFATRKLA